MRPGRGESAAGFGRGDDTVGNPHEAQNYQFELFELILLSNLDRQSPVEQFEPQYLTQQDPPPLKVGRGRGDESETLRTRISTWK